MSRALKRPWFSVISYTSRRMALGAASALLSLYFMLLLESVRGWTKHESRGLGQLTYRAAFISRTRRTQILQRICLGLQYADSMKEDRARRLFGPLSLVS